MARPRKNTQNPEEAPKMIEAAPEKKKLTTRSPKKAIETKAEPVLTTIVQVGDLEFDITDIARKAYKSYKSVHKRKAVTELKIYVKPEEGAAYYTINGEGSEDFKMELNS